MAENAPDRIIIREQSPERVLIRGNERIKVQDSGEGWAGPQGPPGPAGPRGGVNRFYGEGEPGTIIGAAPNDEYVDTLTGQLYVLQ